MTFQGGAETGCIISLPYLVAVHRRDVRREAKARVGAALGLEDVAQQVLLAAVGREDGDGLGRVPQQPHVLEDADDVLGLGEVLWKENRIQKGKESAREAWG